MQRKKIVIVDDNLVNLKIGMSALKPDFHVFTAISGSNLFAFLDKVIPDLIILDIEMPGMDGFEIFEAIKSNQNTEKIPVIFLTSSNSVDYEKRGFIMGAADFLHKPYYPPFLNKKVKHFFEVESFKNKNLEYAKKLKANQTSLADLQMRLLKTVLELVERRNEVSGGHIERTRKYVEVLLDVLIKNDIYSDIVTSWEKDLVLQSTMLYDLGKISVEDSILLKPDKLADEEYSAVKKHPLMGVKIIDGIRSGIKANTMEADILGFAREFAGYHHEKWDGSGYPNGLKGYNIPLTGRLMAIADVYDALISKRSYKNSYSPKEAEMIISRGKGTHFDPVLVDAFVSVADKFGRIAAQGTTA